MRNKKYALFPVLLGFFLVSGGCGLTRETAEDTDLHESVPTVQEDVQTEELTEKNTGQSFVEVIQATGTQAVDGNIFEYEIRELPAQRDGNQIYGVAYIPLDAGEQMPARARPLPCIMTMTAGRSVREWK